MEQGDDDEICFLEGKVLYEKGSLKEALQCFMSYEKKLIHKNKVNKNEYHETLLYIGLTYFKKGDYKEAL